WGIDQRFGGAASAFYRVPGRLEIQQRKLAIFAYTEAGNRVIAAVGHEQKPPIPCEDDAACALKRVRCAFLATDRLEHSGTGAACRQTSHLGKLAARRPMIVHDSVAGLIRLHVEMSTTLALFRLRRAHAGRAGGFLCSSVPRDPADNGSPSQCAGCNLQKRPAIYEIRAFWRHLSLSSLRIRGRWIAPPLEQIRPPP